MPPFNRFFLPVASHVETDINPLRAHEEPMRKRVDIMPVIVIFLIAIFVLGFGAAVFPIAAALVLFLIVLIAAFVVLARSMMRR